MLRIILFLLLVAAPCFARDVVLYVSNHDDSQNLFPNDVARTDSARAVFASSLATIDSSTVVLAVPATRIEDLSAALKAVIEPSDTIRGVVLEGHSNPTAFYLSRDARYSAAALGVALGESLDGYWLAPHFAVGLAACHTGQKRYPDQDAFHESFLRAFLPKLTRSPATVKIAGHLYGSNEFRAKPMTGGLKLLHRTWIPHLIERIGDRIAPDSTSGGDYHKLVRKLGNLLGVTAILGNLGLGVLNPNLFIYLPFSLGAAGLSGNLADSTPITATQVSVVTAAAGTPTSEERTSFYNVWAEALGRPEKLDSCGVSFRRVLR